MSDRVSYEFLNRNINWKENKTQWNLLSDSVIRDCPECWARPISRSSKDNYQMFNES